MKRFLVLSALLALCGLGLIGCGGGSSTMLSSSPQAGAVFVTGEDAPLPSVVSLNLTINSITLTGQNNSPQLVASPVTVDFARLVGVRAPCRSRQCRPIPTPGRLLCCPVRSSTTLAPSILRR